MKLTKPQAQILLHRIESGTIPEVLSDCEETDENFVPLKTAEEAVAAVEVYVRDGFLPLGALTREQRAVVVDCLEGATIFADWQDAVAGGWGATRGQYLALFKAANQLEAALSREFGRKIQCVRS